MVRRRSVTGWLAGVTSGALLFTSTAQAQQLNIPRSSDGAEAALPDINAIEKGARTRASVSFGSATLPEPSAEPGTPGGQLPGSSPSSSSSSDNVRRLAVPPPEVTLGGRAGIYGLDSNTSGFSSSVPSDIRPATLPEQHVVKKGDTLTSVCELYFNDPWCWPRLWSENSQVTNPHWIFPGDVLRLRGATRAAPKPSSGMRLTSNRRGSLDSQAVLLREMGFIDTQALAESGRLTGSREEKIMLASGDQAYVGFPKDKPLKAGERYTIFVADTKNPVRNPDTGQILGYMVRVYGDIVLDQIAERNVARGTLVELAEPVERGFGVSTRVRAFKQIEPRPSAVNVDARIVASFTPTLLLAAENFVVLSRGARDGLLIGNRIFIVRRGDGYRPVMEGWEPQDLRFPKELVAELLVVDVRENAAVAWVARSTKELRVGEVAEIRKGH